MGIAVATLLVATAAPPGYAAVPIERGDATGWWFARVTAAGQATTLMLDTGAAHSELYAKPAATADVRVGPTVAPAIRFRVNPSPQWGKDRLQPAGLGGLDLLAGVGAVMDFHTHRLFVRTAAGPARPGPWAWGRRVVPLAAGRLRYLEVSVHGRCLSLAVDSGGCINALFVDAAEYAGYVAGDYYGSRGVVPSGAGTLTWYGNVYVSPVAADGRDLTPGEFNVIDRPDAWPADDNGRRFDGVVGLPWLIKARATLDLAANALYLPAE